MKLTIFNGSPRREKSNSTILINHFLNGYSRVLSETVPILYIADKKQKESIKEHFKKTEIAIVIFPLYTDCMPAIVKEFFENIAELKRSNPLKIAFIVQSGFPEAIHSTYVERYLIKLTKRLKFLYLGTIIKGGVEGIQLMPPLMTKKLFRNFEDLGEYFAKNEKLSPILLKDLRKPYEMSSIRRVLFGIISKTGLTNFYWDSNLKKNGAFKNRFDKPFEKKPMGLH